ncbi:MAG TPA: hypothetical protein PLO19_07165 [Candidatus Cryosericum sp.]|nr:hypothetical protein [Candidatus Cryosericum sp.]
MMLTLYSATITTALTGAVGSTFEPRKLFAANMDYPITAMSVEFIFTYGSGGTTAKAWLQTSFDDGATWVDVANFAGTTSTLSKLYNFSGLTPVTTAATITDGSLADNTVIDGLLGDKFRVKVTTTGTYAGSTTLKVVADFR